MSEIPADTEYASILKIVPDEAYEGNEVLQLTPQTKGKDVLATLRYMTPNLRIHQARLRQIIQSCIDPNTIDDVYITIFDTPEMTVRYHWDKATTEAALIDDLHKYYGYKDNAMIPGFELVLSQIIDHNILTSGTISGFNSNEMLAATDGSIATEMRILTEKYRTNG